MNVDAIHDSSMLMPYMAHQCCNINQGCHSFQLQSGIIPASRRASNHLGLASCAIELELHANLLQVWAVNSAASSEAADRLLDGFIAFTQVTHSPQAILSYQRVFIIPLQGAM